MTARMPKLKHRTDAPSRRTNYRWILVSEDRWDKVMRTTDRMEQDKEQHPFKLTVNRVASMIFADAVDRMPEP